MKRKDLAAALDISASLATRYIRRGMPEHDIAAARLWRKRQLDPSRTKDYRAGGNTGMAPSRGRDDEADGEAELVISALALFIGQHAVLPVDEGLRLVATLGALAAGLLKEGRFAEIEPALRAALRAIPHERRAADVLIDTTGDPRFTGSPHASGECSVPVAVWEALLVPLIDACEVGPPTPLDAAETEVDDDAAGAAMYAFAAGEWTLGR